MSTDAGAEEDRRRRAVEACVDRLVGEEGVTGIALAAGGADGKTTQCVRGHVSPGGRALEHDDIFAVASITKLFVATAAMRLVERGLLTLGEKVCRLVPDFRGPGRASIRVRHLLTHTSGLPDLLPDDLDLRRRLAPLADFREASKEVELLFPAGTGAAYSSLGFLWLAEILRSVTGANLPELLRAEIFGPLGMTDTRLGGDGLDADGRKAFAARRIAVELGERQRASSPGDWNGDYWLELAAPWGGAFSTLGDLEVFARGVLASLRGEGELLSPAAARAMTANQLAPMPDIPEAERRCRLWGLGWQHVWPNHPRYFGDLLPPGTVGHGGACGTVLWLDPASGRCGVILTTRPVGKRETHLARLANAIGAATT